MRNASRKWVLGASSGLLLIVVIFVISIHNMINTDGQGNIKLSERSLALKEWVTSSSSRPLLSQTSSTTVTQRTKRPVVSSMKNGGEQVNVQFELTQQRVAPNLDQYWSKILHFVPKENSGDCLKLFETDTSRTISLTPSFVQTIAKFRERLSQLQFLSGQAPEHKMLTLTYQELARQKFVHTVCEIGFNAGQSAIAWLTAKPDIVLQSFDIGTLPWTKPMLKFVKELFPQRFNYTVGDSRVTVPNWTKLGKKCDIVSVDGGHDYPLVSKDLANIRKIAADEHILIADDIYYPGVNKAWKEMMAHGLLKSKFECWIHGLDIDFVIGQFI